MYGSGDMNAPGSTPKEGEQVPGQDPYGQQRYMSPSQADPNAQGGFPKAPGQYPPTMG